MLTHITRSTNHSCMQCTRSQRSVSTAPSGSGSSRSRFSSSPASPGFGAPVVLSSSVATYGAGDSASTTPSASLLPSTVSEPARATEPTVRGDEAAESSPWPSPSRFPQLGSRLTIAVSRQPASSEPLSHGTAVAGRSGPRSAPG